MQDEMYCYMMARQFMITVAMFALDDEKEAHNAGSWHTGDCCCNCDLQITLDKHNNEKCGKGGCFEFYGYACLAENAMSDNRKGTFSNHKHGFCEVHTTPPQGNQDAPDKS